MDKFNLSPVVKSIQFTGDVKPASLLPERGVSSQTFDKNMNWKFYCGIFAIGVIILYIAFKMRPSGIFGLKNMFGEEKDIIDKDDMIPMFTLI